MPDPETIRVLIVDDERDFLAGVSRALQKRGIAVTGAESAADALARVREQTFDVAVLDVRLPDGDGHDLFLEIKKHYPEIQGIILTGNRDENRQFRLSHQGLHDYLDKPCDLEVLAQSIRAAYQHGREQSGEAAAPPGAPAAGAVRVLLIDDEAAFLKSLARLFQRRGMVVFTAANGEEGLRVLEQNEVDVAVIDLKMPGLSGLEVLKRLKEKKPEVEALILTGHATVESGVAGMKQGAADYLFKPQDPDALARAIAYAARRKAAKAAKKKKWWPFGQGR